MTDHDLCHAALDKLKLKLAGADADVTKWETEATHLREQLGQTRGVLIQANVYAAQLQRENEQLRGRVLELEEILRGRTG